MIVETAFDRDYKRDAYRRVVEIRRDARVSEISERLEYQHAVESIPRRAGDPLEPWLRRIVVSVEGKLSGPVVKGFDPEEDVTAIFGPREVDQERVRAARRVTGERE